MASESRTLYIGVTGNIQCRVWQHKTGYNYGFTKKYRCHQLVYYEEFSDVNQAIAREKQLKTWRRSKKLWLIRLKNPEFEELNVL